MTEFENALSNVSPRETTKIAALDIGSNSFHLVIARIVAGSVQILHRVKQKVRLAEGLNEYGMLSQDAIERGMLALQACKESMQGFKPDTVRIVATHTLRRAKNADQFINEAAKVLPYPVEVIAGVEEARLIYQGVAHTISGNAKRLVIDIGGGSTEFIIGEQFEPQLLRSVQMGCVSYTNRFFSNGEFTEKAFNNAITAAQQAMEIIADRYLETGWQQCIGSSGTIRTIANLQSELMGRNIDTATPEITLKGLQRQIKHCINAKKTKKLKLEQLTDDRRPVYAAGLSVLTGIFRSLKIDRMEYSAAALREGVLYEMEERLQHHDIRQRTANSIAVRYDVDIEHAKRVLKTTKSLYNQCKIDWHIDNSELRSLLGWSALLHEVGLQINSRGVQRHSAYILRNIELPGFNQEQQQFLAAIVACHRKKIRIDEIPALQQFSNRETAKLIALLRLGVLLNIHRQDDVVPTIECVAKGEQITLKFPEKWLEMTELMRADLEMEAQRLKALTIHLSIQ